MTLPSSSAARSARTNPRSGAAPSAKAGEELGRSIITMLLKEPFYGHLLGGIMRRVGDEVPTAAVALTPRGPELIVNPRFFLEELNSQERVAVIKHETLHLVFRHLYRPLMKSGHPQLFNVAADLVVNQLVAPWPLPQTAVTLKLFPDLGLSANQTLEWYYEKLIALHQDMQKARKSSQGGGDAKSPGEDQRESSPSDSSQALQATGGESAAQNLQARDASNWDGLSAPRSAYALERIMGSSCHGDHRHWAAHGGFGFDAEQGTLPGTAISETLRSALESAFEGQLIRARDRTDARQWGTLPAALRSAISQMEERRKPRIDWRRKLRIFASAGYRTRVVPTNRRMSKRFGTFPGIRIQREQRVAVVIDTSGSINQAQLEMFFSEIHGVWRTGAEVMVVECDAAVQRTYPYKGKIPQDISGGGGTAFDPAFQWLRQPQNGRFDACLYLTDGYGPQPQVRPRCPLMWVVTDISGCGPHLKWGQVVSLDSHP